MYVTLLMLLIPDISQTWLGSCQDPVCVLIVAVNRTA